jgi:hypothetical protein
VHVTAAQHEDVGINPMWNILGEVHGWSVPDELDEPAKRRKHRCHDGGCPVGTNGRLDAIRTTAK